jgi:hypothetical protein
MAKSQQSVAILIVHGEPFPAQALGLCPATDCQRDVNCAMENTGNAWVPGQHVPAQSHGKPGPPAPCQPIRHSQQKGHRAENISRDDIGQKNGAGKSARDYRRSSRKTPSRLSLHALAKLFSNADARF